MLRGGGSRGRETQDKKEDVSAAQWIRIQANSRWEGQGKQCVQSMEFWDSWTATGNINDRQSRNCGNVWTTQYVAINMLLSTSPLTHWKKLSKEKLRRQRERGADRGVRWWDMLDSMNEIQDDGLGEDWRATACLGGKQRVRQRLSNCRT